MGESFKSDAKASGIIAAILTVAAYAIGSIYFYFSGSNSSVSWVFLLVFFIIVYAILLYAVRSYNDEYKAENANKEVVKQAKLEYQQLKEKERLEIEGEKEEREREALAKITEKDKLTRLRQEKEQEINDAYEVFKANAPQILVKIRELLANNIKNPKDALNRVSKSDITRANYDDMAFKPTDDNDHCIGLLLLKERYADACRFYIDLAGNDDINRAKDYINSVYDMISFNNQSFFLIVAKRLVKLKVLGREDDAVNEFAYYALCSREIARQVFDML